jgi:hypothetical protein
MVLQMNTNAAPQAPCEPRPSTPGPSNRIAPTADSDVAGPAERDSLVQPAVAAPDDKTDTPRTDAQIAAHDEAVAWVERTAGYNDLLEHARQLERENFKLLCELHRALTPSAETCSAVNNDLTRKIDKMHDAIIDTEASGRPAGNLFQVWWLLKTEVEKLAPSAITFTPK